MVLSDSEIDTSVPGVPAGDPRLPEDVFPEIVSHLSYESIENAMFVCRYFRTLAQPRFFRMLAIKPFATDGERCSPRNEMDINWIFQKLQFYSSPMIKRHVQVCRISPRYCSATNSTPPGNEEDNGRAIVNDVFDLLPSYPNLTELDLDCVGLTAENLRQMSRILRLDFVLLTSCTTTSPIPVRIATKTVLFKHYLRLASMPSTSMLLSSLLAADVTESLCLMGDEISMASYDVAHIPPLHCLRTLCINTAAIALHSLPAFLSQLPALREIIFHDYGASILAPLTPFTLPLLEAYEGPLCDIARGRPIRHLRIQGKNPVDSLLGYLRSLESTVEIESLEFHVSHVNEALLNGVFDEHFGFPKLKALAIEFDIMDHKILTHILPKRRLPPDVEYISIIQSSSSAQHYAASQEPLVPRRAYLTQYPSLRYVAFVGEGYMWRFDPSTGAPLKSASSIEDWRSPPLTKTMIQRLSRHE